MSNSGGVSTKSGPISTNLARCPSSYSARRNGRSLTLLIKYRSAVTHSGSSCASVLKLPGVVTGGAGGVDGRGSAQSLARRRPRYAKDLRQHVAAPTIQQSRASPRQVPLAGARVAPTGERRAIGWHGQAHLPDMGAGLHAGLN